jgi:hypothetical protein
MFLQQMRGDTRGYRGEEDNKITEKKSKLEKGTQRGGGG